MKLEYVSRQKARTIFRTVIRTLRGLRDVPAAYKLIPESYVHCVWIHATQDTLPRREPGQRASHVLKIHRVYSEREIERHMRGRFIYLAIVDMKVAQDERLIQVLARAGLSFPHSRILVIKP